MISNDKAVSLYQKARTSFKKCIEDHDNASLENEVECSLSEIVVENSSILIKYEKMEIEEYFIETELKLISPKNSQIGRYIYIENKKGECVDDILVFDD